MDNGPGVTTNEAAKGVSRESNEASFLPEEIALIHNTTEGMNVIASSMDLEPGDEVIVADQEHSSGTIPWKYWQETKGMRI